MARMLSEKSQFQQQSRPKTDYERWLAEQDQSYSLAENPQYHPPIAAVEDGNAGFHPVPNDGPPETSHHTHSKHPEAVPRPVDQSHGRFLSRANITPHALLEADFTEGFLEHLPYRLSIFLLFIAFLYGVKTLTKRGRRRISPYRFLSPPRIPLLCLMGNN